MKVFFSFLLFFSLKSFLFAQTPVYDWAKNISGLRNECIYSVASDNSGNVYGAGYFDSVSSVFNSTTVSNTSSTAYSDAFLVKYDSSGSILWIKTIGGSLSERIKAIDVDSEGNVYVFGSFSSTSVTIGSFVLTSSANSNLFLAKYNANGDVVWAKKISASASATSEVIDVNDSGKLSLSGSFGTSSLMFESVVLTNTNTNFTDLFVAQYDLNGNFLWVKQIGGMAAESAQTIKIDSDGNTYFGFNFASQSIQIESTILNNNSNLSNGISYFSDFGIVKLNPNGELIWANRYGGNDNDFIASIGLNSSGDLFLTGSFQSSSLNIDGVIMYSNSGQVFNSKLSGSGNVIWATNTGNTAKVASSVVDANGNLYVSGNFFGSANFNGINVSSASNAAIFISKFNSNGLCEWVKSSSAISFISTEAVKRLTMNNQGDLFYSGYYTNPTFTLDSFTFSNTNNFLNSFVTKISYNSLANSSFEKTDVVIYPNPTFDSIRISGFSNDEILDFTILDLMGREIINQCKVDDDAIDVTTLNSGVYLLRIGQKTFSFIKK
ncbi:MAG: T9SS type A sorting domain-containing protein [Flavobacteriales bacterium]|nr:T9SS type A sorting domain-containing protein [Flavobacteriales bacterium]